MSLYSRIRKPLFRFDAEKVHSAVFHGAKILQALGFPLDVLHGFYGEWSPELENSVFDVRFSNPVGLAAGFDKNAELVNFMAALGFGFVEVGSISNLSSAGNPKPRMFRLEPDLALINRLGLNNHGADAIVRRLATSFRPAVPLGINIVKTNRADVMGEDGVRDVVCAYEKLLPLADYMAINVSCPNTSDGRTFEDPEALAQLFGALKVKRSQSLRAVPLLVKFSSDTSDTVFEQALRVCEESGVDGFIVSNTTPKREGLMTDQSVVHNAGAGGLSGRPLFQRARERVEYVYHFTRGKKPIIGVGGVDSAATAYEMIQSGASLVQLYTGLVYQGPSVVKEILRGLRERLHADGLSNISQAIGSKVRTHRGEKNGANEPSHSRP